MKTMRTELKLQEKDTREKVKSFKKKEQVLREEIEKLRETNDEFIQNSDEREKETQIELHSLREEISNLQSSYAQREKDFIEESTSYIEQLDNYQKLLAQSQQKLFEKFDPNHYSVSSQLKEELGTVREQLFIKEKEVVDLRERLSHEIGDKRAKIEQTLNRFEKFYIEGDQVHQQYKVDVKTLNDHLLQINEYHNQKEEADAYKITTLTDNLLQVKDEL